MTITLTCGGVVRVSGSLEFLGQPVHSINEYQFSDRRRRAFKEGMWQQLLTSTIQHIHTIYLVTLLSVGQSAVIKTRLLVDLVVLWEKLITNNSISIKDHCQRVPGTASGHCPLNSIMPLSSPPSQLSGLSV